MGGDELRTGISLARVKKVHRRLVKSLHPDRAGVTQKERFLVLQTTYEKLSRSLEKMRI